MKSIIKNTYHQHILGNVSSLSNREILTAALKRWRQKTGYFLMFTALPAVLTSLSAEARAEETNQPPKNKGGQNVRLLEILNRNRSNLFLQHQTLFPFAGSDNCPGTPIPSGTYTAAAPFTDIGDTTGANNTVNTVYSYYYYSSNAFGPDQIYSFTLTGLGANPRIEVSAKSTTYRPMIYILNSDWGPCPNGTNNHTNNNFFPAWASAGGTATYDLRGFPLNVPLYLFIDSPQNDSSGSGPYTLRMQDLTIATTSPPSIPLNVVTAPISPSQINVNWNVNPGSEIVTSYNLRINGSNVITGITSLPHAVNGLTQNTTYTFEVQAVNQFGASGWSSPASAKTFQSTPTPPTIASATAVSPTQIDVFWNQNGVNENVIDYNLRINGSTLIPNITFLSYAVRNLTEDTPYTIEVQARNSLGLSPWSAPVNARTQPDNIPPKAPPRVTPQVISPNQINVFWDASTSSLVTGYNLRIDGSTVISNIQFLSYAVRNLTPNTTYTFEVQAINAFGVSPWTTPFSATTNPLLPPPRVLPQDISTTQINVFWDASPSPNITSYNLRVNGSQVINNITFLSYAVRNLTPGTAYSFEVQSVDVGGNISNWSTPVNATTLTILPPPRVSPQTVSTSQINVFWDAAPSLNVASYNLRINGSTVINDIRFLSYAVRNLDPGTTYSFEVQSVNADGNKSNWSTPVNATTQSLAFPQIVSPQTVSSTQINVFWDASPSPGISKYNLRVNGTTVISDIAFLSYAVRNLNPNTAYIFEVQAVDSRGFTSAWSTPQSATTAPAPLPSARVSPQVVSQTQINVFWDASTSPNVVGYNLRVNGTTVIPNIAFLSYAVTGLAPGTTYTFEVQTIETGGGVSNWTTPNSATTLPPN